jgi:hypothetical protein
VRMERERVWGRGGVSSLSVTGQLIWDHSGARFASCTDGHHLKYGIFAFAIKGFHV